MYTEASEIAYSPQRLADEYDALARVLSNPESKVFLDLRDRLAYVFVSGSWPCHLRPYFQMLLRRSTFDVRHATSFDGGRGRIKVERTTAIALDLRQHPMVRKVRGLLELGYLIRVPADRRRNYWRIYLHNPVCNSRLIVKVDGAVKESWD